MESGTNIRISKHHLSKGEVMELQRIAAKLQYSEKEVKFVLSMAARTFRMVRNSFSVDRIEIKSDDMDFIISSKSNPDNQVTMNRE